MTIIVVTRRMLGWVVGGAVWLIVSMEGRGWWSRLQRSIAGKRGGLPPIAFSMLATGAA